MQIRIESIEGTSISRIVLTGRLDIAGTQEVDLKFAANTAAQRKSVIIDMTAVDFIASIGVRLLITNAKALSAHKAKMVLLNPQELVAGVLKTSGVDTIIPIAPDLETALKIISG